MVRKKLKHENKPFCSFFFYFNTHIKIFAKIKLVTKLIIYKTSLETLFGEVISPEVVTFWRTYFVIVT